MHIIIQLTLNYNKKFHTFALIASITTSEVSQHTNIAVVCLFDGRTSIVQDYSATVLIEHK